MFFGLQYIGIEFDSVTQNHFDGVFCKINYTRYVRKRTKLYFNCQNAGICIGSLRGAAIRRDAQLGHFCGGHPPADRTLSRRNIMQAI